LILPVSDCDTNASVRVTAAQSGGQAGQSGREIRRRHPHVTPGAAGRDCSRLCFSRSAILLELHHRRGAANHRRLFRRLIGTFPNSHEKGPTFASAFSRGNDAPFVPPHVHEKFRADR